MFAHVSPEGDSFGETVSTLKFAQRVSTVELGAARINKESSEVLELKQQVYLNIIIPTIILRRLLQYSFPSFNVLLQFLTRIDSKSIYLKFPQNISSNEKRGFYLFFPWLISSRNASI